MLNKCLTVYKYLQKLLRKFYPYEKANLIIFSRSFDFEFTVMLLYLVMRKLFIAIITF